MFLIFTVLYFLLRPSLFIVIVQHYSFKLQLHFFLESCFPSAVQILRIFYNNSRWNLKCFFDRTIIKHVLFVFPSSLYSNLKELFQTNVGDIPPLRRVLVVLTYLCIFNVKIFVIPILFHSCERMIQGAATITYVQTLQLKQPLKLKQHN